MDTKIDLLPTMDLKKAETIHRLFTEKGLTLSVAESCTGGLISHVLTALPGASRFFEAGVIVYSAAAKRRILGIPGAVLEAHGVISEETARQMAERVRSLTGTSLSVSTTGNLGPDLLEDRPRGLVYVAVSTAQETFSRKLMLKGSRAEVNRRAVRAALSFLADVAGHD
jgi:PncC family amidohydrolase